VLINHLYPDLSLNLSKIFEIINYLLYNFKFQITPLEDNEYRSVLTLNSSAEIIEATYFCIGENSQGIAEDSVVVNVRREMTLDEGFNGKC
jgi:hypothetical protein